MSKRKSASTNSAITENPYNIYEAALSLKQDFNQCPFTGLPAVHLKLMCSPVTGLLTRFGRKLFFGQSKDFYAGILDKWILLYPSKSNDMKPSEYFYPIHLKIAKGENQFIILTNKDKRYHFQAPNKDEFSEWIANINRILDDIKSGKMKNSQLPQLLTRKLPSPPSMTKHSKHNNDVDDAAANDKKDNDVENYYSFAPQSINSNDERLYEECASSMKVDLSQSPPALPVKQRKKVIDNNSNHGYDTPKSTKVISELSPTTEIATSKDDFVIKEEEKCEVEQVNDDEENRVEAQVPKDYEVSRVRVSEMTAILSNINLISPEEKRKSSSSAKSKALAELSSSREDYSDANKKRSKSPVKRWFSKNIGKRFSQKNIIVEDVEEEENINENENDVAMATSVNGSKVNMIINQLEKSGQLKALRKGLKSRKSLKFDKNNDYEPVAVTSA
jgi:hypothetical protein